MKYTEQNYPLLRFLKWTGQLGAHPEFKKLESKRDKDIPFLSLSPMEKALIVAPDIPAVRNELFRKWPEMQKDFLSNIEMISLNFLLAMEKSYDTFLNDDIFREMEGPFNGTLIMPGGDALLYQFEMASPRMDENRTLHYKIAGNVLKIGKDGKTLEMAAYDNKAYNSFRASFVHNHDKDIQGLYDFVIVYHLFKKYANINIVEAKSIKHPVNHLPEFKTTINGIKLLDASWYTTIIRSEGFNVKGHFRLQPYGPERKMKKLIYIHEFQKHGYIRRAKMLTKNEK